MFQKLFSFFFLALLLSEIDGHTYHFGSCPDIEPITDFNMNGMLGVWYVIEKTSSKSTCMTYNFTKLEEPYCYNLEEVRQRSILGLLSHEHHSNGKLFTSGPSGKMQVKFSSNVIGKASFTVFMTDYQKYAGIFTCQGLGVGHRQSVSILSRTPTLDQVYIDKIHRRLSSYDIDSSDICIISQQGCFHDVNGSEGVNINFDDETGVSIKEVTEYIYESINRTNVQSNTPDLPNEDLPKDMNGSEGVNVNVDDETGSKIEEVTENIDLSTDRLNTDVESITPEVPQNGSTESDQSVNFNVRSNQREDFEWLP